jgi:glutamyl-tRNA synthetase
VSATGAIFDHAKLDWFNGIYIRNLSPAELANRIRPFLGELVAAVSYEQLEAVARLLQDRLRTLSEAPELADYLLADDVRYEPSLLVQKG